MVARVPLGLSSSAILHAGALTALVLISMVGKAPLPDPTAGKTLVFAPPLLPEAPRVAPEPVRPRGGAPRRRESTVATPVAEIVPAVPQVDPLAIGEPSGDVPVCLGCQVGEPGAGIAGDGVVSDGSSTNE